MVFKFKDGSFVPEDKYQECAEKLEKFQQKYGDRTIMQDLIYMTVDSYARGDGKFSGGIFEVFEDHPELKNKLDISS